MVALAVGKEAFRDYSHKFSPKTYTQPQLFACLVIKEFEKKDYRGVQQLLLDCSDLREAIGLTGVPHYTTIQKASQKLLPLARVRRLIDKTLERIYRRFKVLYYAAVDSSGFDVRHASRYFIWRTSVSKAGKEPKKRVSYRRYGKLMLIIDCATHAIVSAVASAGPTPDINELDSVVAEMSPAVAIRHMVGDAGFDSAHNHRLLREEHGMRSTIPPEHGRPPKDPERLPTDPYRRLMKRRFNKRAYRHRPQVETVFSMLKRNFGSALRGRGHWSRCRDMMLRVITHNISLKS